MYCFKCKSKTSTYDGSIHSPKNGKYYIKGKCKQCHSNKTQIISKKLIEGGDIQSTITKVFPNVEWHHRTFKAGKIQKHNFTGPGTNLDKRIENKDEMVNELIDSSNSKDIEDVLKGGKKPDHDDIRVKTKPIDSLDEASFRHDLRYDIIDKICKGDKNYKKKGRRRADKQMVSELDNN